MSTVVGKIDYEGDVARIEGDAVPNRKMIAKVVSFLTIRGNKGGSFKGKQVIAQIIDEGEYAGWIERVEELPLNEKLKKAGFSEPTPAPAPQHNEVPPRGPDELFSEYEVAAMKKKAAAAQKVSGIEKVVADTKAQSAVVEEPRSCTSPEVLPAVLAPSHQVPVVAKSYSADELSLLRNVIAKGCTEPEFKLLMYMASTYGLDPLRRQIWAVKRSPMEAAVIFAGRDGFLEIAHRSGVFDGMESGIRTEGDTMFAWCKVYRKDMSHPFLVEVERSEYDTKKSTWAKLPRTMLIKVAESQALRRAFSVSGMYDPCEINTEAQ